VKAFCFFGGKMHKEILELKDGVEKLNKVVSIYSSLSEYSDNENRPPIDPKFTIYAIQNILKIHDVIGKLKVFEDSLEKTE
jgi:hypothetical protein